MILVIGFGLAALFALMAARPLSTWRVTQGWTYKHPGANQPSETALGLNSLVWAIAAVICAGGALVLHDAQGDARDCDHAKEVFAARDDSARRARLEAKFGMELNRRTETYAKDIVVDVYEVTKGKHLVGRAAGSSSREPRLRCTN